ncbi:hypothetical protein K3N28_01770 [Glycomyces sp. TRM65418]|nr:hypothetical protein [Glycomyces sp. TRM65418]MCC3761801.1 hypothetical protein [Glycomyces sp. TRM65418]QZD55885.1 hypothetical protein K3N28_01760 [Glycomyces sp. TRM65418]
MPRGPAEPLGVPTGPAPAEGDTATFRSRRGEARRLGAEIGAPAPADLA